MTNKWRNLSAVLLSGAALIAIGGIPGGGARAPEAATATSVVTSPVEVKSLPARTPVATSTSVPRGNVVADQWMSAIQSDAFGDNLIFADLATLEPITDILKKGVVSFERKTLRSPNYKAEDGYDLLIYEVQHPLSQVSRVLAYVREEGDARVVEVLVLSGRPGETTAELVQFDGKTLSSQRRVTWLEAQKLFDRELNDASTLMSASIK